MPINIVAYALTLLWANFCRNSRMLILMVPSQKRTSDRSFRENGCMNELLDKQQIKLVSVSGVVFVYAISKGVFFYYKL